MYDAVLAAFQHQYHLVLDLERILKYAQELPDDPKSLHRFDVQLAKLDDEIRRNQEMKLRLIENLNDGILSREEYLELSAIYDNRIRDGRFAKKNVEAERDGFKDVPLESEWLTSFKKYHRIDKLDRILLAELVHAIEVHDNKAVTVHFRFDDQIKRVIDYLEQRNLYHSEKEDTNHGTKEPPAGTAKEIIALAN